MSSPLSALRCQLYLITDGYDATTATRVEAALSALPAGRAAVQLRAKTLHGQALYEAACALREVTRGRALLFVNDRFDVALAAGADGVHLPAHGLPPRPARRGIEAAQGKLLIGCSTHSLAEAKMSARAGADFVTFGPVFATASKAAYGAPVGLDALAEVARALPVPVFALGGIDAARAPACLERGARVACIGAVLGAEDPAAAARSPAMLPDDGDPLKVRVVGFWTLGGALLVAGGLGLFAFDFPRVRTNDMAPGLREGNLVLACRVCESPQRGDVVVFAPDDNDSDEKLSFQRVIAVPGDKIEVRKGQILVNDRPLFAEKEQPLELPIGQVSSEPVKFETFTETTGKHRYQSIRDPQVSSPGEYPAETLKNGLFVLADRRTFSRDSRHYGPVLKTRIRSIVKRVLSAGDKDPSRQTWLP